MKVRAIEEAKYIGSIKVDELDGSLQTLELALNDISKKKNKNITFRSNTEEDEDQGEKILSKAIALIGIKFNNS